MAVVFEDYSLLYGDTAEKKIEKSEKTLDELANFVYHVDVILFWV